jgi:hypothetical protein
VYVLYSVHIGPWFNPTSCAVHIEGYFVLGKTDWGMRITTCHILLTAMRLKMKKLRPHFPHYHNPFSLMLTPCTTRLIIHSRWALNSSYCPARSVYMFVADCVWNLMAHAQKPDFVFRRNGRVHLKWRGRQFIRLLAAELFASAVVMLDKPCSEVVWRVLATHSILQFPVHFPSHASPCAITFQTQSTLKCIHSRNRAPRLSACKEWKVHSMHRGRHW